MNLDIALWEATLRLGLASVLGGIIGWEREQRGKAAGLRTNMIVCLGAATFTLLADSLVPTFASADPTRIVTGVATGIGFLGAGSILKSDSGVKGVTTAASIWVVGAVGAACGIGGYAVAGIATAMTLLILWVVGWIEKRGSHLDGT